MVAAKDAFENVWSKVTPAERGRLLNKLADLMERDAQVLAELESMVVIVDSHAGDGRKGC